MTTKKTSCPCPDCLNCCCHAVEGLDPEDCVNEGTCTCGTERVPVLCGCGWGHLAMPVDEVPEFCPLCGNPLYQEQDGEDFDDSMDGDHESALASAGWGCDEDYGSYVSDSDDGW